MTLEKMGTRVEDGESRIYLFLLLVQRSDEDGLGIWPHMAEYDMITNKQTPEKMAYSLEQDKLSPCIIT